MKEQNKKGKKYNNGFIRWLIIENLRFFYLYFNQESCGVGLLSMSGIVGMSICGSMARTRIVGIRQRDLRDQGWSLLPHHS